MPPKLCCMALREVSLILQDIYVLKEVNLPKIWTESLEELKKQVANHNQSASDHHHSQMPLQPQKDQKLVMPEDRIKRLNSPDSQAIRLD